MLGLRESCRNNNVVYRGTNHAGQMGHRTKFPLPACPACSNYPNGGRWPVESRHCSQTQDFSAHRPTVATTLLGSSAFWPGKGCPSPWPYSTNLSAQDHCCYPRYLAHNSSQRNALEYAQHGQDSRSSEATIHRIWKQHNLKPHLIETFKLSRDKRFIEKLHDVVGLYLNPPTKPWFCASTRKVRFKPSIVSTSVTLKTRNPSTPNPRLQTQRNHHSVRSLVCSTAKSLATVCSRQIALSQPAVGLPDRDLWPHSRTG